MLLVSFIGEQPIPNLLPIRHLQPAENLLVYTANENASQKPARRLRKLVTGSVELSADLLLNDAYRPDKIREQLEKRLAGHSEVIFNLTGGTKPMALAGLEAARNMNAPCIYMQTEGRYDRDQRSVLYWYTPGQGLSFDRREELPRNLLDIDSYLRAHLDGYSEDGFSRTGGGILEQAVAAALEDFVDEIKAGVKPLGTKDQVEIDLLVRRGNQVAALEVKSGGQGSGKKALDQLTTMVAREYLGTYAARVIITNPGPDDDARQAWYKALARALRVTVIEFNQPPRNGRLDTQDAHNLRLRLAELLP
jgi:hypothetical protein